MSGLRVLVVAGDAGAGQLRVARTLAGQLREQPQVDDVQLIEDPSTLGSPSARLLSRRLPGRLGALAGAVLGHRALAQTLNTFGAHVVVSESPGLSAVLGQLRSLRRLPLPLVAVNSDGGAGPAARGVDMHLVFSPDAVSGVEAIAGPGTAMAVQPLVDRDFLDPPSRGASRGYAARALKVSLKGGRPLVLISAGAGGADDCARATGELAEAAEVSLDAVADAVAVVIAGDHPERVSELETRFVGLDRVRVLAVADRPATLLAAADVLIDTAGGAAALEARLVGCPVISFGAAAHAHGHADADGGAECAHSRGELGPALARTLERERPSPLEVGGLARAVDVVIATAFGTQRAS